MLLWVLDSPSHRVQSNKIPYPYNRAFIFAARHLRRRSCGSLRRWVGAKSETTDVIKNAPTSLAKLKNERRKKSEILLRWKMQTTTHRQFRSSHFVSWVLGRRAGYSSAVRSSHFVSWVLGRRAGYSWPWELFLSSSVS
jgi:hypothetical protein